MMKTEELLIEAVKKSRVQRDITASYAAAIRQHLAGVVLDWSAINAAIVERWSGAGLVRIKTRAWKIVKGAQDA